MRAGGLRTLIVGDLRRNAQHFILASIGIVVGIAAFTFFLALGSGVRNVVLGEIFPLDKLEVVPRTTDIDLGPLRVGMGKDTLDDQVAKSLGALPHVSGVFPKMKLTAPSTAVGGESLLGNDMRTELIADGIDPALVQDDVASGYAFKHFDDGVAELKACESDEGCDGKMEYCGLRPRWRADGSELTPAERQQRVCRHYVPVMASNHLVEIYNGTIRRAHNLPKLNPEFVVGLRFDLRVGESMVDASKKDKIIVERGRLVGFSARAIPLGLTLPLGYVGQYNVFYGSPEAASTYHSIIVDIDSKDNVAAVAKSVEDMGFDVADSGAEQAALLITIFMMVFGFVSVVIVGIAAVNIMHVFFMLIYQRQREIGIMRAVGATRANIRALILGEAALVGLVAGCFGVVLAFIAGALFDTVSARYIPDFPYKPETYFSFDPPLLLGAFAFAIGFCVLGAALPARRAARMDPALVLTGH
ncbi:MAG: ABC transporter permease [Myxococcales bacterium]|nr:ABC transporter permease [Myxococcales bacterium]MCB9748817.1 ABC transporter permease [Myxococcales bacterium]